MARIGRNIKTKGVIMALLTLVLMNIGCEDKIDNPAVNPSEGKKVEVALNIGFADEVDGATLSAGTKTTNNGAGNKQAPFDMQLVPASQTRAGITAVHPDKFYNLEIHQYNSAGGHLASSSNIASQAPGTTIASLTNSSDCQLLIIARSSVPAVASLANKSLSEVRKIIANATTIKAISATDGTNINNMPYLLFLPHVKIESGKIVSPEGTDVRLLLKRLAVGVTIDWTFSEEMKKGYTLSEVRLMQVPKDYRILPETENDPTFGEMYPTSISEFVDGFRLTGDKLTNANGSQTFWMPANVRGTRNDVTYPTYRNKNYAHSAATYVEFVVNSTTKNERLLYRAYLGGNTTNDFNLFENTNYHWTINLNTDHYTSDQRIQLQDLSPVISTNVQTTSNCFMMQPGTNICFNPFKHDAVKDGYRNDLSGWNSYLTDGTTLKDDKKITQVKIVWQTKDNGTTGELVMGYSIDENNHSNQVNLSDGGDLEKARIHVKVPVTSGGNAVIAAYHEDIIVWSWHLWITNYVPQGISPSVTYEQAQKSTLKGSVHQYNNDAFNKGAYSSKVIMDRNLGATAGDYPGTEVSSIDFFKRAGFQYFWGRKDPFFGIVDGTTNEIDIIYNGEGYSLSLPRTTCSNNLMVNGNMMQYTIQHPNEIITSTGSWYDNNPKGQKHVSLYDELKTLYDPCPAGWKIAPKDAFTGLNAENTFWHQKEVNVAGRLYNISGGTTEPNPITIHNSAWFPVAGNRAGNTGNLKSSSTGYIGTSTTGTNNYAYYYLRFYSGSFELVPGATMSDPAPFRCIQK